MNPDSTDNEDFDGDEYEPDESRSESLRALLKTGYANAVSVVRNAPQTARVVWNTQRPWLWLALALFLMALPALRWAFAIWTAPASPLTFQPFVPLAVGLLFWNRREIVSQQYREMMFLYGKNSPKRRGKLWVVIFGCVLLLVASVAMVTQLALFALVIILIGTAYYLYGPFLLRPLLLPLSYLFLLTPPPTSVTAIPSLLLRFGSLLVSGQLLHFLFKDAEQKGAFIVFPSFVLQVSEAASGVNILFPLLALALWLAILRRIIIGSSLVLLVIAAALAALLSVTRLCFIGAIGALMPEVGNALQTEGAMWLSSLLLGLLGAYLIYKIAVLLSPPRLA